MRTIAEVMTSDVRTARTNDIIGPIRDLMLDGKVHGVPVVDQDGGLAGIVTSSDLVEEWAPEQGVTTVMRDEVETISASTSVAEAARTMLEHRIHHLVVVDDGRIVGLVSSFDLLRALAETAEATHSRTLPPHTHAVPGDIIVIRGHAIGQKERRGVIVEARGTDGGPPFVVNWLDDPHAEPHDVLFSPGSDADIEHPAAPDAVGAT
jgi:CBS domain-containing protein